MQKLITDILKKYSFAVILNVIGLIGSMVNLYIVTKLYPLVETDRRLEYQIQAVETKVNDNERLSETKFEHIKQQLDDIKDLIRRN